MYTIKVFYTTGDSFGSNDTSDVIEITWKDLAVAKENLKRIEDHYNCYKVDDSYNGKQGYHYQQLTAEQKLIYDTKEQQDWYVNIHGDYKYTIKLKTDDGNVFQMSPSWVGYFEHLNYAEINIDPVAGGLKIEF